jgi:hypothetical protein
VCKIRETLEAWLTTDKRVHGAPMLPAHPNYIIVLILSICVAAVLMLESSSLDAFSSGEDIFCRVS